MDHLFRHESGKLVSVLTRIFGVENIDLAGDVVQDSVAEALSQWQYKGIPDNPSGWLFRVAKNKALNLLNREKYRRKYSADTRHSLLYGEAVESSLDGFFSDEEILDDQLRMIFTCCHPALSPDSQIALALKTLCGFSVPEIARSFLTTEENIKKRLTRAKQAIREDAVPFDVPAGEELHRRTGVVLETIYLLFNEGYSAYTGDDIVRYDLCAEAIRLAGIIEQHPAIRDKSGVCALLSLMYFNASRFTARQDREGRLLTMAEQDRSLWDRSLIAKGIDWLRRSTLPGNGSVYFLLAMISAHHCMAPDYASTDWKSILECYDSLVQVEHSPVVLLNRAIALSKVEGPEKALRELEPLQDDTALQTYPLFYSTKAELHIQLNRFPAASDCLEKAIAFSTLEKERRLLQAKLIACREKIS
ncbi:MAG TPA: sigma-70 family RNA polymerase sigma factor [Puia sp.]|nr:sigma-70 family RNA polymerase sigma factor [Puia sp.]